MYDSSRWSVFWDAFSQLLHYDFILFLSQEPFPLLWQQVVLLLVLAFDILFKGFVGVEHYSFKKEDEEYKKWKHNDHTICSWFLYFLWQDTELEGNAQMAVCDCHKASVWQLFKIVRFWTSMIYFML